MPAISSSLSTNQPYIPLVQQGQLGKAAGLSIQFDNHNLLTAAVAQERQNMTDGSAVWRNKQLLSVASETQVVRRVWFVGATPALSHARTVVLPSGEEFALSVDANVVHLVGAAPASGFGAVGDMAVSIALNARYIKTDAVTWSAPAPLFPVGPSQQYWAPLTAYAARQAVVSPDGSLVTAFVSHTSAATFDPAKWIWPSDDGSTIFDFTRLPDSDTTQVRPTKGHMPFPGVVPARASEYGVYGGRFRDNPSLSSPPPVVYYFQGALIEPREKVQHFWIDMDVMNTLDRNSGMTLLLTSDDWSAPGSAFFAPVHWQLVPRVFDGSNDNFGGIWICGPYNTPAVRSGPDYLPVAQPRNSRVRLDITVDVKTGTMCGFYNGALAVQYNDPDVIPLITHRAIFEASGVNFQVREFGLSPHLPTFHTDGSRRALKSTQADFSPVSTLNGTWQRLLDFYVAYDAGGAVQVDWNPLIVCSSGNVQIELSSQATAPSVALPQVVAEAPTSCRVAFSQLRTGTPGTTERIGIWARTTGTATLRDGNSGNVGGPRWRPSDVAARYL